MGTSFENEDSPPWLDCFLKSFSIESPLLESGSLDNNSFTTPVFQQEVSPTPLPPMDGFYQPLEDSYVQLNSLQYCSDKWSSMEDNCSPSSFSDSNSLIDSSSSSLQMASSPESQSVPSPSILCSSNVTQSPIPSTSSQELTGPLTTPVSSRSQGRKRSKKTSSSSTSRKKPSYQSLKEKRDEQACKKIAQCRLGFSLEKKVIIPIFLALILKERKYNPSTLRWIDQSSGVFKVEDQDKIAELWATMKRKSKSCYGNFSRSIRHHHHTGYLEHDRRKLIFKFSSDFTFWK